MHAARLLLCCLPTCCHRLVCEIVCDYSVRATTRSAIVQCDIRLGQIRKAHDGGVRVELQPRSSAPHSQWLLYPPSPALPCSGNCGNSELLSYIIFFLVRKLNASLSNQLTDTAITTPNMPTTEIAVCALKAGVNIGDDNDNASQIFKDFGSYLQQQDGMQQLYFGMQVESPQTLQLFVSEYPTL